MKGSIRTFYLLLITQTVSLIGSQMTSLAIGIQVFNDTGDVLPLALIQIAYALPMIITVGFAGVVADKWNRRWVLILADAGQAIGTVLLLLSFGSGQFQLWHLYGITFIQSLFGIFQYPAFQASVTMLVPDEHRDRANAIQQITNPAAGIIAPALAGILFTIVQINGIILIDLATFCIAILILLFVHIPQPEPSEEDNSKQSIWREVTAGFRILWQRRILFYLIIAIMSVNFLWNVYSTLQTPYILSYTGSEAMLGILLSISSAGYMVGGLLMTIWRVQDNRMRLLLPSILAIGVFMILFGIMRAPILMAIMIFLFYIPHPIVNTLLTSIIQLKTPPETQGRVFATVTQLAILSGPIALLFGGVTADYVMQPAIATEAWAGFIPLVGDDPSSGMRLMIIVSGMIYTFIALMLLSWSRMRHLETELPDFTPDMTSIEPQTGTST